MRIIHWRGHAGTSAMSKIKVRTIGRIVSTCLVLVSAVSLLQGQEVCIRITAQDSTLNNLVDPPDYKTAKPGTLGAVHRTGKGTRTMLLIPGLGFGGGVFKEFMDRFADDYRMYAVTLPGFGGTPAPPSPDEGTSFGKQTWTNAALSAIEKLMEDEALGNPIIVGHWLTGTQLALRLAMKHPDKVKGVIILAGASRIVFDDPQYAPHFATPEKRVQTTDKVSAPFWFKTVTRETWDDNNFLPGDYAINPVRGLRLWREAAVPPLHVWVRYLLEFQAQDISPALSNLTVPTLILKPGLDGVYHDSGKNYMEDFCHKSWEGFVEKNAKITVKTIPNSRACLWFDQPAEVNSAVSNFLKSIQ